MNWQQIANGHWRTEGYLILASRCGKKTHYTAWRSRYPEEPVLLDSCWGESAARAQQACAQHKEGV